MLRDSSPVLSGSVGVLAMVARWGVDVFNRAVSDDLSQQYEYIGSGRHDDA